MDYVFTEHILSYSVDTDKYSLYTEAKKYSDQLYDGCNCWMQR
jgi:hypothetical protein